MTIISMDKLGGRKREIFLLLLIFKIIRGTAKNQSIFALILELYSQKRFMIRPTVYDMTVYLREGAYLPADRQTHQFRNHRGYFINSSTAVNDFTLEFKKDFEEIILPQLEALKTLSDCLKYFEGVPFWSNQLKKAVAENDLL